MTSPVNEILISFWGVDIYYYGVFMSLAIIVGVISACAIAKKFYEEIAIDDILDLSFYLILGAILGARIYYVLASFDYYSTHLWESIMFTNGGLSIHGGILGGIIAGGLWSKFHQKPFFKFADIISYGLILGQAIGRLGNYFNSEAFGAPCDLPWKLFIPISKRPMEFLGVEYFHPTFLYEIIWNLLVFSILFFVLRKIFQNKDGAVFFSYLILYSLGRIIIESIRIDSVLNIFGVPLAIIVSILCILAGVLGLIYVYAKFNKANN